VALDPQLAARVAARAAAGQKTSGRKRRRRPPAGEALRETRAGGQVRAAPGHRWLDSLDGPGPTEAADITEQIASEPIPRVSR